MTTSTRKAVKAGDKVLGSIARAQGSVVETLSTASQIVGGYLPTMRRIEIPATVPTTRELIAQSYSFARKVLDQQKKFALGIVDATEPVWASFVKHDEPKTRKTASKAA